MRSKYSQSQFELFPGVVGHSEQRNDTRTFFKSITISIENFVVLAVVIVISMVTAFSIGVERGKKSAALKTAQRLESAPPMVTAEPSPELYRRAIRQREKKGPAEVAKPSAPVVQAAFKPPIVIPQVKTEVEKISEKQYTVQVASFKKEHHAQEEAKGLKNSGYEIFVMPKGNYSIVCVGKFGRKAQAKEISRRLRKKYKDCLIRSL